MSRRSRVLPVALGLVVLAALPAGAQGPARTGWWSTAPADLSAVPTSTAADGLHVANGPDGRLAFAAVSYHLEPFSSARLTLHLAPNTLVGTPLLIACPTVDDTWRAGGNQPTATAPAYSCAGRSTPALVSSDSAGATVSFLLDAVQELRPGMVSLAIVPSPTSTTPFSLDLLAPSAGSMVTQPVGAGPPAVSPGPAAPVVQPAALNTADAPVGAAALPMLSLETLVPQQFSIVAQTPVVAPGLAVAAPPAVALQYRRVVRSAEQLRLAADHLARQTAMLALVALVGGLGYLLGHQQDLPLRLLGGRAPRGAPGEPVPPGADTPMGGLGRFARPRTTPARKLT